MQATVTYRVADPALAAARLDFSHRPATRGRWRATPLDQIATLLTELAQQPALDLLAAAAARRGAHRRVAAVRERGRAGAGRGPAADRASASRWSACGSSPPARARAGAGAADPDPRAGPAGGRPGHLRAPGARGRAGTRDRARTSCRTRSSWPPRGAARRAARRERAARRGRGRRGRRGRSATAEARAARDRLRAAATPRSSASVGAAEAEAERARLAALPGRSTRPRCWRSRCASWPGTCRRSAHLTLTPDVVTDGARPAHGWPPERDASPRGSSWSTAARELDELLAGTARAARPSSSSAPAGATSTTSRRGTPRWRRALTRGRRGDPGRLAARARRARRPGPLPLRPGGHRGRRRAGRAGRQRREVPRRAAGHRRRPRARPQPGRARPVPRPTRSAGCCRPVVDGAGRGRARGRWSRRASDDGQSLLGAQRGLRRTPDPPVGALPARHRRRPATSGSRRPA